MYSDVLARVFEKNDTLVGANPMFDFSIFNQPDDDKDVPLTKKLVNQLCKDSDPFKAHTEFDWDKFSRGSEAKVWASNSLDVDLDLQVTEKRHTDPVDLFFVLCVGRPPLLIAICGKKDSVSQVEEYAQLIGSKLHSRLLDFCHLDFRIVPLAIRENEFTVDVLELALEEQISFVKSYHPSRLLLNSVMMQQLTSATIALSSATFVYGLLNDSSSTEFWLLLMNSSWRSQLYSIIEKLGDVQKFNIPSVGKNSSTDAGLVTLLEATLRMSFSQNVRLTFNSDPLNLKTKLQRLVKYYESQLGIEPRLHMSTRVSNNASLVVEVDRETAEGRKLPERKYERQDGSTTRKLAQKRNKVNSADREKSHNGHEALHADFHRWASH